ncbi:MAG: 2-oxoacid:acceptor oxidoreductase family protein [Candidatus Omnitrophica bacterium]|nr:2-oxoacid:acceptor oxidoreductase family protein [Candidatus Omnitrophota bacterium]MBU4590574.1 2-oxoacid:acceptor oxidoreductase family protein [Candidatus Omnitrophota bacterium]
MIEIRWHGRGGQGAKTASQFLGEAALDTGKYIQSFPEYGPERAGAPMKAFNRISEEPIYIHSSVTNPEIVVVIDPTLVIAIDVIGGLGDDGVLLVNTDKSPEDIRKATGFKKGKVGTVDATKIALETLKLPMPNMPMLGALLKVNSLVTIDQLSERVRGKFLKKIGEEKTNANLEGIKRAYNEVKIG